ncbi:MAG: FHA domain-containing protein [Bdellovibrio sp.]|nr:MAG: FHA domain-containing protein [Bdellovibrio sp.]
MWGLRLLNGSKAGKTYSLKQGANIIGRSKEADIIFPDPGVSKKHAQIDVLADKIILTDLGSSNGTFVNGIQIRAQQIFPGDKIGIYNLIVEVVPVFEATVPTPGSSQMAQQPVMPPNQPPIQGNLAYNIQTPLVENAEPLASAMNPEATPSSAPEKIDNFLSLVKTYINNVVLPGVYRLGEWMELKYSIALLLFAFVLSITSLSAIPLIRILKDSTEEEARQTALVIAEYMGETNQEAVIQGMNSALSTEPFEQKAGVKKAIILGLDGQILAPARLAGRTPEESYIQSARKKSRPSVDNIDDNTVVAVVPIMVPNPVTGLNSIGAFSVIVYDMKTLAINSDKTLSLLIQTFFIALLIGSILFFFLYKLIEHPIEDINSQLDKALSQNGGQVSTTYQFPILQQLCTNINSTLSRMGGEDQLSPPPEIMEQDRQPEMNNLVELIGFPAIAIDAKDRNIMAANEAFSEKTGIPTESLLHQNVEDLLDQSLRLQLIDLIDQIEQNPEGSVNSQLEFSGVNHEIVLQPVLGTQNIAYYLAVILPLPEDAEVEE